MHNLTLYGLFQSCEIIWMLIKSSHQKIKTLWWPEAGYATGCLNHKSRDWNLIFDDIKVNSLWQIHFTMIRSNQPYNLLIFHGCKGQILCVWETHRNIIKIWNLGKHPEGANFLHNHNAPPFPTRDFVSNKLIGWTLINFWLTKTRTRS